MFTLHPLLTVLTSWAVTLMFRLRRVTCGIWARLIAAIVSFFAACCWLFRLNYVQGLSAFLSDRPISRLAVSNLSWPKANDFLGK